MKPTIEEIEQSAKAYSESTSTSEQNEMGKYSGYIKGFNDAISLQPEWVSVSERLPELNHSVMMYRRDYQYPHTNGYCIGEFDGERWLYMSEPIIDPTRWHYLLPQPPTK